MGDSADPDQSQPGDTLRQRVPGTRFNIRVLLELDRRLLAALLLGGIFVALVPFLLLLSSVLRIATVAKRTLAIGSFVFRETERTDDSEWDYSSD